ncbi:hypothetical protein Q7C36_007176 [Tachysurus vachellii]|uniref:Uncharacterized protein n=1 Tax=Tachysurus vachellii TaxID=175792 RepID=A0AA88NAM0_TACVA|nr:hypothetical protein Q7C36_007176 [Tachysurus vachellii]
MCAIRKLFISCVVMLWMNLTLSEVPHWCCVESFTNKSVMFTVNTTKHCIKSIWNKEETPIIDEHNNVSNIVLKKGPNWILLKGNISGINFKCMDPYHEILTLHCTDPCDSGKADTFMDVDSNHDEGHGGDGGDGGHGGDGGDRGPRGDGVPDSKDAEISVIASIAFISVAFVILSIIWKSGRYRRCCANRPEANHANGGFQAVGQVDQQETIV